MKILCISDTHNKHYLLNLEQVIEEVKPELVLHAGDFSYKGTKKELEDFCQWYDSLDIPHKVFIAGNHDFCFERNPHSSRLLLREYPSIQYLEDSSVTIKGLKIWGSPWQPWFHDWAFNFSKNDPYNGLKEAQERWSNIPDDTDILITHGPPANVLDEVANAYRKDPHVGCSALIRRILKLPRLKLHVFGHIHEAKGFKEHLGINFVNASMLDRRYQPTVNPFLITL